MPAFRYNRFLALFLPLCWFGLCPFCRKDKTQPARPAVPPGGWETLHRDIDRQLEEARAAVKPPLVAIRPPAPTGKLVREIDLRCRFIAAVLPELPVVYDANGQALMTRELQDLNDRVVRAIESVEVSDVFS